MAGELVEVLGRGAWFATGSCPAELAGKKFTLKSSDGEALEVEAEGLCMARHTIAQAQLLGADAEIALPFKKATVAKIVEYFKYHKDNPPSEIRTPLESDNLVECGVSKWDTTFINVDKEMLFELMAAASVMDIPSLTFLAAAKASLLIKGKTPDKLLKDFKLSNDLPEDEEETLTGLFAAQKERINAVPDESGLGGIAILMNGVFAAAEKNDIYASTKGDAPGASAVSLKSYRMASWRTMVLSDWTQLGAAPEEVLADRDLIYAALGPSRGAAIQYAAPELRADKALVLEAVKYNPELLREADRALTSDPDFVTEALKVNGTALVGASDSLRGNKEFVLKAAQMKRGSAMKGATHELKADKAFVLECTVKDPEAFKYASDELRWDRDYSLQVVSTIGAALQYMPYWIQADREVAKMAVATDPQALVYVHSSARAEMGAPAPWDSEGTLLALKKQQDSMGIGNGPRAPQVSKMIGTPLTQEASKDLGVWSATRPKLQKSVQFSALSTMTANMGQANYIAANCYLDKLVFYERPEIDSVTMMWGAVGGIGMRWKAFASADFLNANPEALMSVMDAARVLNVTTTRMDPPEWYAASFFDEWTRTSMLAPTAGMHKGNETYMPINQAPAQRPKEERKPEQEHSAAPESGPLGGWPTLTAYSGAEAAQGAVDDGLAEGIRVRLDGLQSKNGQTGTLLRLHNDGKWKVQMDMGGVALLKACYLVPIGGAPVEVKRQDPAELRKQRLEARKARLQAAAEKGQADTAVGA